MPGAPAHSDPPGAGPADPQWPLRVAMVIQSYPPVLGGAQRQLQRLGPLLERRGVVGTVITRRPAGQPALVREPGLEVRRLSGPSSPAGAAIAYVAAGTVAVARARPRLIHVFDLLSPGMIGLLAGAALRVPVVAKVLSAGPGGDVDRLRSKPLGARRLALMASRFSAFATLAGEVEEELRAAGVAQERMIRIPNGVDATHFRPATEGERATTRAGLGIAGDALLAVYCGRLAPVKRLDVLLEAFAGLSGHLVIAGEGNEAERVRRLAGQDGLAGRVHLLHTLEDTARLLRAADVYVSASLTEGMSGSVLEALSSGVPVVASPASGMSLLVRPDTGVLAADDSAGALRRALAEVAGDRERRLAMGRAGRALVSGEYSLESTADRLVELYRRLTEREAAG